MKALPSADAAPPLPAQFLAPPDLRWGRVQRNNTSLRWAHIPSRASALGSCVVVGGFSECAEKYFETMSELANWGLTVWFLDWYGQGGSDRPAEHPTRPFARNFVSDADDLAHFAALVLPFPRLLIAHSMGAAIGLSLLARRPELFQAAVLSAPMLQLCTAPIPISAARLIAATMTKLHLGDQFAPGRGPWTEDPEIAINSVTTHDPLRARVQQSWFLANPRLRVDGPTYGWVHSAFGLTRTLADPSLLRSLTSPILMGCPTEDLFVETQAIHRAASLLPNCVLRTFDGARHELFMEADCYRSVWLAEAKAFACNALHSSDITS